MHFLIFNSLYDFLQIFPVIKISKSSCCGAVEQDSSHGPLHAFYTLSPDHFSEADDMFHDSQVTWHVVGYWNKSRSVQLQSKR